MKVVCAIKRVVVSIEEVTPYAPNDVMMRPDKNADLVQIVLLADGDNAVAQNAVSRD